MPMAYIKFVNKGAVDPEYGVEEGAPGIDNELPPGTPPIGVNLPEPPPGIWPPPSFSRPIVPTHPIAGVPPGTIWPPVNKPARPDNTLPSQPARPDHTLPGGSSGTFWVVCGIPGIGWRYICVDPSLGADNTLPGGRPPTAGQPLPPTPEPKR